MPDRSTTERKVFDMTRNRNSGYSLVELLITVAIITIVTSIALPSYRQHVQRSHRSDATAALLRIAAQQEKFYLQNNTYTATLADLNITETENGWYTLAIGAADTDTFSATAKIKPSEAQQHDKQCSEFAIDAQGNRTAKTGGGADSTEECWR